MIPPMNPLLNGWTIPLKATKLGKGEQQISMQFPQKYLSETKMFSKIFSCSQAKIESTFVYVRPAIDSPLLDVLHRV
jgi:hypothetical protein